MKLTETQIRDKLKKLQNWKLDHSKLQKSFRCRNFSHAVELVNEIAERAEMMDHHPDIRLHDYNMVTVCLMTHRVNGLTEDDFVLAHEVDQIYQAYQLEDEE